jgi:hypothetical protein
MEAWAKDQKTGLSLLQLMGDPKVRVDHPVVLRQLLFQSM